MASNSSSNSDSQASKQDGGDRKPLPFEPSRRKSADKSAKRTPAAVTPSAAKATAKPAASSSKAEKSAPKARQSALAAAGIPDEVSNRMLRRMAFFCGVPTALGASSFFISYFLVTQGIQLPHVAVLLVSLGLFGLGVVGLTYGALSASWEDEAGSLFGLSEFRVNFGRMVQTWRSAKNS